MKDTLANNRKDSGTIIAERKYEGLALEPSGTELVKNISVDDVDSASKEEEWLTKKKTELTTTTQIETRTKRQVVLEDGKVVGDSGPIVSTNTTVNTDKVQSKSTERRDVKDEDEIDNPRAIETIPLDRFLPTNMLEKNGMDKSSMIIKRTPKTEGLVREVVEKRVVSKEEIEGRLETEDIQHFGDFSDEVYVAAANSGADNIKNFLFSQDSQKQLVKLPQRITHESINKKNTVDTEDTDTKYLLQPDGTIVTEKKVTKEHDELIDREFSESDDQSISSKEKIEQKESSHHFHKQRDEQHVSHVADGKVIGTEMRYLAETEHMERNGAPENSPEWESLTDRVRARRQRKTLPLKDAIGGDRKDALTNLPLDFGKEEEIRKTETTKWLESHFGSESRSSLDSKDDDFNVERERKTFFNVTIKSNSNSLPEAPASIGPIGITSNVSDRLTAQPKVFVSQNDYNQTSKNNKKFQSATNRSDHKDSPVNKFSTKSFQDDLKKTIEKKHKLTKPEDLIYVTSTPKPNVREDEIYYQKYHNVNNKNYESYYSPDESDDSKHIKPFKENHAFLRKSREDLNWRHDSPEEPNRNTLKFKKESNYVQEDHSGYLNGSFDHMKNINRYREDAFHREQIEFQKSSPRASIQRDDSTNGSSSNNLVTPKSPKSLRFHSSGKNDSELPLVVSDEFLDNQNRPIAPQRKRVLERKLRQLEDHIEPIEKEPHPDYSPSHNRSISPTQHANGELRNNTIKRTQQKTTFEQSDTNIIVDNSKQTTPSKSKMGSAIGNSIRKLVGKLRSASAERKLKAKAKQNQRTPSPQKSIHQNGNINSNNSTAKRSTYQQYNVIDGHIGEQPLANQRSNQLNESRETSISSSDRRDKPVYRRESSDIGIIKPKQQYYLGEDPYGGSIYGKENKYDGTRQQRQVFIKQKSENPEIYLPSRSNIYLSKPMTHNSSTLDNYSKSTNRLTSSQHGNNKDLYRSVQTLPRKLERNQPMHSSTVNVTIVNSTPHNQGPAKPARTYKSLNRSKSLNVHGLNGTNDPSPIYISNLTRINNNNNYLNNKRNYNNNVYKSSPLLNESETQLKSPSIVNLVSCSQKDLTKIDYNDHIRHRPDYNEYNLYGENNNDKKQIFLKGLQRKAPELYKTLHGDEDGYIKYIHDSNGITDRFESSSIGSRGSPINTNMVKSRYTMTRRDQDYPVSNTRFNDNQRNNAAGSVVIELRNRNQY